MFRFTRARAALLLFVFSSLCPLYSQDVRATITGLVTDPSGAPVAGATVRVRNTATNATASVTSNDIGNFVSPYLQPGSYVLTVERDGFKKFVRESIVLQSQDKPRLDITLEIGTLAESVTVSDVVSTLQTETASRSQTLSTEMIANLPTQGRNPFQIAWSAPGVVKTGTWRYLRSFDIGGTSGMSINGGRSQENDVLLDGVSNVRAGRNVIHVPTMESVQEFKVLTNTYDSQYGRTGGGVVTIVTKGGGNEFHGNAFEYFQNEKLNANQSELNSAGKAKPPMRINNFGLQASGPIYIPKVIDGRNRLFWLISYEGLRQRSADPGVSTMPLMEWRNGDFSTLRNAQNQQVVIYDPLTTVADGSRQPFTGNVIPSARISPVAKAILQYYPAPTSAGSGFAHVNNYIYPSRWVADMDQWIGRADYIINSRNTFFFRYGQNPFQEFRGLVWDGSNVAEPTGNAPLIRNGRNWTVNWTSTLSARMTFDLRAGLSRWEETTGNSFGAGFNPANLGFASSLVSQFTKLQFPRINLDSYQAIGSDRLLNYGTDDTYSIQPNFGQVVGSHFLKYGVELRRYNDNVQNPGMASGVYSFTKSWTQALASKADATSGNELAGMLLGYPTSASVDRNIDPAWRHHYYALYLNDDWKLTPNLTLNLGLRWDYESPNVERYDRMVRGLDLNAASPIAAQAAGLGLKGAMLFANKDGQPRTSFVSDKNNLQPRIGVAWRVRPKWVLRGGYGLYYLGQNETGSNQGFSQTTNAITTTDNLTPAVTFANAFALLPNGQLLAATGSSAGAASFLGQGITVNWLDRPLPYSHQYSFDIQRELPGNILVEVGYVGNQTRKLPIDGNPNAIFASALNRRTASGTIDTAWYNEKVANPMAGLIPNNAALNGATIARSTLLTTFPQFSSVSLKNLPIGKQRYDALQAKVTRRFANGLTFLASYTVSKTLEQVSMLNAQDLVLSDPSATPLEKRPASQIDTPQKFSLAGVWELPFGSGKAIGSNIPKLANHIIGGWELNWNISYMVGWALDYPNAAQVRSGSAKLSSSEQSLAQWFDASLWNDASGKRVAKQDSFTLRDFPTRFSDVRVPASNNWDASLTKMFHIHERLRLQFRFEMVNAMNHPWYADIASVDVTNAQFGRLNPTQRNLPRFLKLALNLKW
ncbi:MAG TPA: TonB-dependent receptor [Bryobacteraceae bacterium]|nr:TonB-dependent receptor [Bryobacteraceae bacterium]